MGIFDKEIALFKNIEKSVHETVISTVKKYDFVILDYNTNKQLQQKGEDSTGQQLGTGKYSKGYARIRVKRGLQIDHIDTHFTGHFHATLEVIVERNQFKINSKVDYADDLVKRYGSKILGLQQKYLKDFTNNYLYPQIKKMINDEFSKSIG